MENSGIFLILKGNAPNLFARRFFIKQNKGAEFETMTEDQILEKLDAARQHADEGKVMDADVAISKLWIKYGL